MFRQQYNLNWDWAGEIIVDLFAGGGGMSTAMHIATGISPHIACNHDEDAISMHEANHPQTRHYQADVYELDPHTACGGRPVGLLHASPDCTHHSQAAGGQPRDRKIRSLSWVVKRWAAQVRPRVITLENVRQITKWGPLVAKRCKETGRVLKRDGTVARKGERVPVNEQYLIPDPKHAGRTWTHFVRALERLGYQVDWRLLCAADYGAPTTRERLFLVARCDGQPIVWPAATHHKTPAPGQKRWRAAAECIDWSIPGKSILDRDKPLAEATMRRIAKGIHKFVLDDAHPFIVPIAHYNGSEPVHPSQEPLRTITAYPKGGCFAIAQPIFASRGISTCKERTPINGFASTVLINAAHGEGNIHTKRRGIGSRSVQHPLGTETASAAGGHAVAAAYLMQANDGYNTVYGKSMADPMTTVTSSGSHQQLVFASLIRQSASNGGSGKTPLTVCARGNAVERALRVAAFLVNYYGNGDARDLTAPMDTLTTKDRLALVTVFLNGDPYYIVDITLRMLAPHELYKAQGFPDDYIMTHGHDGRRFSKTAQVRMCGNSVSPPPAIALIKANYHYQPSYAEAI